MLKAVVDTNIFISGTIMPKSKPAQIIKAWRGKKFELVISKDILLEIAEVLNRPKITRYRVTPDKRNRILKTIYKYSLITPGKIKLSILDDPDDNIFLACAEEGKADYIVSGDNHLLKLGSYNNIDIVSAETFLDVLKKYH
ncbi:MAG: putative toxin-antitoxin system toxin component, PIN family [Actinobacteria bacterium]|nr:putative toxin-antitoxin system toxin component, PIN family [Actinomycetota bacterium]